MGLLLPALLIGVPIIEISLFIEVGGYLGLWPTIAIVIATAIAGTVLLRVQGLSTLARAQESLRENRFPLREVFDGLCLVMAGALLLTPGFFTDFVGLLLFVPGLRSFLRRILAARMAAAGHIQTASGSYRGAGGDGPTIIEGEFREVGPVKGEQGNESDPADAERRLPDRR